MPSRRQRSRTICRRRSDIAILQYYHYTNVASGNVSCLPALDFPSPYNLVSGFYMSFIFDKKTKKVIHIVWGVVAILVSLSMVVFFAPGLVNLFLA